MKKFTLLAAMAAVAMSASAQYNTDKIKTADFLGEQKGQIDYIILDDNIVALLSADKEMTLNYIGPNDAGRNLYIWSNGETFVAGTNTLPGADDGSSYMSLNQNPEVQWCGAGYNIGESEPANFSHMTDETVFHLAYACQTGSIRSMYLTLFNDTQVSLGEAYESHPVVGAAPTDDWQAIAITLGDLRKEVSSFVVPASKNWSGNILAFGGTPDTGWSAGANISFDAAYLFTPGVKDGIADIADNAAELVVSNRTISCVGAEEIALYSLNGQLVKSVKNSVMGLDNLATGVYVAKAGNRVAKVAVK